MADAAPLVCPRCGRLLNRVTGKCVVCGETGAAPPPIASTTPPAPAPAPPAPAPPVAPPVAAPEPRVTSASTRSHLATVEGAPGRKKRDLVIYDGALVFARAKGGRKRLDRLSPMTPGQVLGLHPDNVMVNAADVESADVWERFPGGEVVVTLHNGVEHRFTWLDRRDRKIDIAETLVEVLPGRVAVEPPERSVQVRRMLKLVAAVVLALAVLVALFTGIGKLLEAEPPPPPPPAPPTTASPAQQAVQAALGPPCGPWRGYSSALAPGARPDPVALRPLVDALRPPMDAAVAADPSLDPVRGELAFLADYVRRTPDDAARESVARIAFAMRAVDGACAAAGA